MWRCSQRMKSLTASFPSFLKVTRIILSLEMFQFYLGPSSNSNVLHFRDIWPHTVIVGWEHPCALWGEVGGGFGECGDLCNLHLLEQQWLNCWLASLCQLEVNHFSHPFQNCFKQTKSWKTSQSLRSSTFAASKETTTSPTPTPMQTRFCWWVGKPTLRQELRYQVNPFNL